MTAVLWIGVWGGSTSTLAHEVPQGFGNWERASDDELDRLRGGFVLPNGMNIDFSLARISSLNGAIVSSSFFQLPDNVSLFQNGILNQSTDLTGAGLGSVIQNNLDNQVIRTVTDINIAVSHLKNFDLNNSGMIFNNLVLPNLY